jgi:non-homologous end joining protein Ku
MQYNVREEMETYIKQNLRDDEIEIVIVPNSEIGVTGSKFRFVEENEFIYNNKLYDIVKKKSEGNNTIFYCINDKNEENLFSGLYEHLKRNCDQNSPTKDKSNNLVKSIIKEALPEKPKFLCCNITQTTIDFKYASLIQEQFITVLAPPPKAC